MVMMRTGITRPPAGGAGGTTVFMLLGRARSDAGSAPRQ
jgi:hypothetical protein